VEARRDLVQAYAFAAGRLASALVSGNPGSREIPTVRGPLAGACTEIGELFHTVMNSQDHRGLVTGRPPANASGPPQKYPITDVDEKFELGDSDAARDSGSGGDRPRVLAAVLNLIPPGPALTGATKIDIIANGEQG
jgi:hypothetical protein